MKGQIATIEALIAVSLVLGTISFLSAIANNNALYLNAEARMLSRSEAIYDFVNQVERNYSLYACINSSSPCILQYLESYKDNYGLNYIEVQPGNWHVGSPTSHQLMKCFYYNTKIICIIVG